MAKRAQSSWKTDYDAVKEKEQHGHLVKRLTADLPINSRISIAIVDDPNSNSGEKIQVVRSIRNDPLADMSFRRVIDNVLYLAGRKWQALHERSTIGSIGAIDPTKEAVDGGKMPDPITDRQIEAFRELAKAKRMLGDGGAALMEMLLDKHMTVGQIADELGCDTGRKLNFLSHRLRECLTDLGKLWGFVG